MQFQKYMRDVVERELQRRNWQLMTSIEIEKLIEEITVDLLSPSRMPADFETLRGEIIRTTIGRYAVLLFESSRLEGTQKQKQAFRELWAYLYPYALYKTSDQERAQEYTQRALIKIWERGDQCRDPRGFLGWCKVVALNEIRMDYRKNSKLDFVSPSELGDNMEERDIRWSNPGEGDVTVTGRPLEKDIARQESIQRLRAALKTALRSKKQYAVIEGVFLRGMGVRDLAHNLGTSPSNIHTLKSRALSRLRETQEVMRALEEFLKQ